VKLPSFEQLKNAVLAKGYRFFDSGDYNLNLVGIRTFDNSANTFNDWLLVAFYQYCQPVLLAFPATTDPGSFHREYPAHVDGTAIMVPGQYPGLWQLGLHQGRYDALVQVGPVKLYRDNNRDRVLDFDAPIHVGVFGINCHRGSEFHTSNNVDKWSAGCQVLANPVDFELLMVLCRQARNRYGNGFTYTLLEENDL
jgi:hypothetical protein